MPMMRRANKAWNSPGSGVQGNYALAMETMALLRQHGIDAHFGLTVSAENESFIAQQYSQRRDEIKAVTFVHSGGIYGQENTTDNASIVRSLRTIYRSYRVRTGASCSRRCT